MRIYISLMALALSGVSLGAQTPAIFNVAARHTTSLNGKWKAIVDPYESGYYDARMQPDKGGYFRNAKPQDKSERIEYDFDTAGQLDVPGDWNSQRDSLFFYEGTVWYRRMFDYAPKANTRAYLYFGAAN